MVIFCSGMYRSGSTLQYQIVSEIIESENLGKRVEWLEIDSIMENIEAWSNDDSYWVVKCHEINEALMDYILRNQSRFRIIYIYRDLRDVFLSHMIKNDLNFKVLFESAFLDECLELYNKWTSFSNIYISRYEDVINNMEKEICEINNYLKLSLTDSFILETAEKYSFHNQQKRINDIRRGKLQVHKGLKFDSKNLLHHNHLNKGEVGGWTNAFNDEQNEKLKIKLEPWLKNLNYNI
ncbi:sulfotransferase domain-containing protein [uncultured Nonlabens sp.]|uniref:sulfotransferase domain-containing protein n=1 Tax=uncultured Nonlabens sp. TaxID=859306 RepID=UPI0030DD385A|tara:strand:+ start:39495 stop:40205 length:711 start_codon:yes stop_codon:yes gene_type:complete